MAGPSSAIDLAERVARIAAELGIETALIGAYALAVHRHVRATGDIDLGTHVELHELRRLQGVLEAQGLPTELVSPDEQDPLGGVLRVWVEIDDEGDPVEPVEVVNFLNSHHPRRTPARDAIRHAIPLDQKPALRYPSLADLIALKLYAGSAQDEADVLALLVKNPEADRAEIRATCERFGFDRIEALIEAAEIARARR